MRIYLGGAMFTIADIKNNLRLAEKLRNKGFEVYCPNENEKINDKTRNDLTSKDIYSADIEELINSNVFLCQISEDSGTMWEAGFMDCLSRHVNKNKFWGVIGLTTDIRLQTKPDPKKSGVENQSMYINQFIVGGLNLSLGIYTDEDMLIEKLLSIKTTYENKGDL